MQDSELGLYAFPLVVMEDGTPAIEVEVQGNRRKYLPEEISALILKEVKHSRDDFVHSSHQTLCYKYAFVYILLHCCATEVDKGERERET